MEGFIVGRKLADGTPYFEYPYNTITTLENAKKGVEFMKVHNRVDYEIFAIRVDEVGLVPEQGAG